jgi:hemerythrin-like metal-binding protein
MPIFEWKLEYSVNIKILDDQHKQLIETINLLHDAVGKGKGKEILPKVLKRLTEYVTTHFDTEEQLMVKYGYPDYAPHKKEHDYCISKVSGFKTKMDKGDVNLEVTISVFLVEWLRTHLIESDGRYRDFFKEKGVS